MHKLYFIARDNMTHDVTDNGGLRVSQRGVPDTEKVTNQFLGIFSTDCMKILIGDGEVRTQRPPPDQPMEERQRRKDGIALMINYEQ